MRWHLMLVIATVAFLLSCEDGSRRIFPNDNSATADKDVVAMTDDDTLLFTDSDESQPDDITTDDGTLVNDDGEVVTPDDGTTVNDDGEVVVTDDGTIAPDDGTVVLDEDVVIPDIDNAPCSYGDTRQIPCGINGDGLQSQTCLGGNWQDQGECVDDDVCVNGDTQDLACGINDRGTQAQDCVEGQWVNDGLCDDPDECLDGDTQQIACGAGGVGTQDQICTLGQWVNDGNCVTLPQTGRWTCTSNTCTPSYGDAACGNGTCDPKNGESAKSCPADCDKSATNGVGQNCSDVYDCAFYNWLESTTGYWTCSGFGQKKCAATKSTAYCGTNGYDYCYKATDTLESDRSCAVDCANKPLGNGNTGMQCDAAVDCIFIDWPPNN